MRVRTIHDTSTGTADPHARRGRSRSVSSTYRRGYACVLLACEQPRRASVSPVSSRCVWIVRTAIDSHDKRGTTSPVRRAFYSICGPMCALTRGRPCSLRWPSGAARVRMRPPVEHPYQQADASDRLGEKQRHSSKAHSALLSLLARAVRRMRPR